MLRPYGLSTYAAGVLVTAVAIVLLTPKTLGDRIERKKRREEKAT